MNGAKHFNSLAYKQPKGSPFNKAIPADNLSKTIDPKSLNFEEAWNFEDSSQGWGNADTPEVKKQGQNPSKEVPFNFR
jgi:hypothetical protein